MPVMLHSNLLQFGAVLLPTHFAAVASVTFSCAFSVVVSLVWVLFATDR